MDNCVIITYTSLLLAVVSAWFGVGQHLKLKPWYLFFLVAVIFGYSCNFIRLQAIAYIAVFGLACYYYQQRKNIGSAIAVIALALPLFLHYPFTGFRNYLFLDHAKITPTAIPYTLYFNFDKTLISVFLLGFSAVALNKQSIKLIVNQLGKHLIIMALVVLGISFLLEYIYFEPKLPPFTGIWVLVNLFFVCTSEELLFRGVIQYQLAQQIKGEHTNTIAIVITAVLFGLMHHTGGLYYILLATICGLFYGHIYFKTKEIRSAIFLHFLVNLLHFLLFTYPAVQK